MLGSSGLTPTFDPGLDEIGQQIAAQAAGHTQGGGRARRLAADQRLDDGPDGHRGQETI